jgi:hypothetical protein
MGKTVYTNSETHVIGEICRIKLPDHCPERLMQAVQSVQKAKGIADVAQCLKTLSPVFQPLFSLFSLLSKSVHHRQH